MSLYETKGSGTNAAGAERDFWRGAFESVVERLPEPVLVVDAEGRITHWNGASESLTNVDAADAVGQVASDVTGAEITLAQRAVARSEVVTSDRIRTGTSAGGKRWHTRDVAVPIHDEGEVVGAFELSVEAPRGRPEEDARSVATLRRTAIESAETVEERRVDVSETQERLRRSADAVEEIGEALANSAAEMRSSEADVDVQLDDALDRTESAASLVAEAATLVAETAEDADRLADDRERGTAALDDVIRAVDELDRGQRDDAGDRNGDRHTDRDGGQSTDERADFGEDDWLPGFRRA